MITDAEQKFAGLNKRADISTLRLAARICRKCQYLNKTGGWWQARKRGFMPTLGSTRGDEDAVETQDAILAVRRVALAFGKTQATGFAVAPGIPARHAG